MPVQIQSLQELARKTVVGSDTWKTQYPLLQHISEEDNNWILQQLLIQRRIQPELLKCFRACVSCISLPGELIYRNTAWFHSVRDFSCLRGLRIYNSNALDDFQLQVLGRLGTSLTQLELVSCRKLTIRAAAIVDQYFTKLEALNLSETNMGGDVTKSFNNILSSLTSLDLSMHDTVTDESVTQKIAHISNLQILNLFGCSVSTQGVQELGLLGNLRDLNLSWSKASKPPLMPSLTNLEMCHCELGDSDGEDEWDIYGIFLTNLKRLELNGSTWSTEGQRLITFMIGGCAANLTHLSLSNTSVQNLDFLEVSLELRYLNVQGCCKLGFFEMKNLANCTQLETLNLNSTLANDDLVRSISQCKHIKELQLANTQVTNQTLTYLQDMECLEVLNMAGCRITGEMHQATQECNASEYSNMDVDFQQCSNKDNDIVGWAKFQRLRQLNLMDCEVTNAGCVGLRSCCEALTQLAVGGRLMSDGALVILRHLTQLKDLQIKGSFTDQGMRYLVQLSKLSYLEIKESWLVTEVSAKLLGKLPGLTIILNGQKFERYLQVQEQSRKDDKNMIEVLYTKIKYTANELVGIKNKLGSRGVRQLQVPRLPIELMRCREQVYIR